MSWFGSSDATETPRHTRQTKHPSVCVEGNRKENRRMPLLVSIIAFRSTAISPDCISTKWARRDDDGNNYPKIGRFYFSATFMNRSWLAPIRGQTHWRRRSINIILNLHITIITKSNRFTTACYYVLIYMLSIFIFVPIVLLIQFYVAVHKLKSGYVL